MLVQSRLVCTISGASLVITEAALRIRPMSPSVRISRNCGWCKAQGLNPVVAVWNCVHACCNFFRLIEIKSIFRHVVETFDQQMDVVHATIPQPLQGVHHLSFGTAAAERTDSEQDASFDDVRQTMRKSSRRQQCRQHGDLAPVEPRLNPAGPDIRAHALPHGRRRALDQRPNAASLWRNTRRFYI